MVQSLIVAHVGELVGELAELTCPDCGIKFMEFRAGGRLGCPHDYWVFAKGLLPLFQRYHGATRHVGKAARRREGAMRAAPAPHPAPRGDRPGRLRRSRAAARPAPPQGCRRMNLDDLTKSSGEWLRGTGPESDIVMCSRIRLARNLADFPFTNRASRSEKAEIEAHVSAAIGARQARPDLPRRQRPVHARPPVPGRAPAHLPRAGQRRRAARRRHRPAGKRRHHGQRGGPPPHPVHALGLSLPDVWDAVNQLDDQLEEQLAYAFSPQLGYLTACPTNVGTGIRVGVMLHLPGLVQTKQIDKVFRALQKINLAVRGLYGEGSQASGDFYQISNQQTLGKSETELIKILTDVVPQVLQYERAARQDLLTERRQHLHDQVSRAYGVLKTAQTISSEETMLLLSSVRMGINLGLIDDLSIATVNELFIQTQPAFLQKLRGSELGVEERNVARASYLAEPALQRPAAATATPLTRTAELLPSLRLSSQSLPATDGSGSRHRPSRGNASPCRSSASRSTRSRSWASRRTPRSRRSATPTGERRSNTIPTPAARTGRSASSCQAYEMLCSARVARARASRARRPRSPARPPPTGADRGAETVQPGIHDQRRRPAPASSPSSTSACAISGTTPSYLWLSQRVPDDERFLSCSLNISWPDRGADDQDVSRRPRPAIVAQLTEIFDHMIITHPRGQLAVAGRGRPVRRLAQLFQLRPLLEGRQDAARGSCKVARARPAAVVARPVHLRAAWR